ncbi:MAG: NTP transferase domain-containing protein, partial [Planctomycetota bacterium]
MEIGVILVAAGEGSRFGGPKAFVELAGKTLLERAAAALGPFADRV